MLKILSTYRDLDRLETASWLTSSRVVRQDLPNLDDGDWQETDDDQVNGDARHAVGALSLLTKYLANLLDIVFHSEEKDKVNKQGCLKNVHTYS